MRIAIVEDSAEVVDLLRDVLEDNGNEVVAFSGEGNGLVSDLATAGPDAVILDLLFRGDGSQLSGWDYLRLVRSHAALCRVPILVCSADVAQLRKRRGETQRDPLLVALEKPFSLDQLEHAVSQLHGFRAMPEWDDDRDLVLVADEDARLVHASAAMLTMLALDPDALTACHVGDIVAEGPAWTQAEWGRYLSQGTWEGPVALRTRSGQVIPASARANIIKGPASTWHVSRIVVAS
jgi:CheY-like chemotaxis protein